MATVIDVILEGDGALDDWKDREIIHLGDGSPPIRIAALSRGMKSGRPSVMIAFDLGDGRAVVAEASLRNFLTAAVMLYARYKDEIDGEYLLPTDPEADDHGASDLELQLGVWFEARALSGSGDRVSLNALEIADLAGHLSAS